LYQQGGNGPILEVCSTFGYKPERLHTLFSQLESYTLAFDSLTPAGEWVVFIPGVVFDALHVILLRWREGPHV